MRGARSKHPWSCAVDSAHQGSPEVVARVASQIVPWRPLLRRRPAGQAPPASHIPELSASRCAPAGRQDPHRWADSRRPRRLRTRLSLPPTENVVKAVIKESGGPRVKQLALFAKAQATNAGSRSGVLSTYRTATSPGRSFRYESGDASQQQALGVRLESTWFPRRRTESANRLASRACSRGCRWSSGSSMAMMRWLRGRTSGRRAGADSRRSRPRTAARVAPERSSTRIQSTTRTPLSSEVKAGRNEWGISSCRGPDSAPRSRQSRLVPDAGRPQCPSDRVRRCRRGQPASISRSARRDGTEMAELPRQAEKRSLQLRIGMAEQRVVDVALLGL